MDGGILSQDEINALLAGMDLSNDTPADNEATETNAFSSSDSETLTEIEKDAIGEVANISMGTSATTLYSLVNRRVDITTPTVNIVKWDELLNTYDRPCVFIKINYTTGLDGSNILILKEADVKIITDLMMGGDGTNIDGELGELHLSAISEAMNQMMGSSATSLSSMLGKTIDISPPEASLIDINDFNKGEELSSFLSGTFVSIQFRMQIGDLIDSTILQLYPLEFARELYQIFMNNQVGEAPKKDAPKEAPKEEPKMDKTQDNTQTFANNAPYGAPTGMPEQAPPYPNMGYQAPPMGYQMPPMGYQMPPFPQGNVNVSPAQFQTFSQPTVSANSPENINLIMDVPLEVTVELGRTKKSIADILDFAPGTIIELDKIAGEPIDVLVNGKFVAKGEVVVIEESFGIRITEIIN
ncbi:MAG: flagellar motor switch phosphatase FliY [Lachnospiraceae bacterium]|nr:flagellar motor switch phosphatase FliY [Lachnospiraceae bacterium]